MTGLALYPNVCWTVRPFEQVTPFNVSQRLGLPACACPIQMSAQGKVAIEY